VKGLVAALVAAVTLFLGSHASATQGSSPTLRLQPGQAVQFSNGFRCSFRGRASANGWFASDRAFVGPTAICSGVSWKYWNETKARKPWLALDGAYLREYFSQPALDGNRGGWYFSLIPPLRTGRAEPDGGRAGKVINRALFSPLPKRQLVPDGTMVSFGNTGSSCVVYQASESKDLLGIDAGRATGVLTACLTPGHSCMWTAVVYGGGGHSFLQRRRDGADTEPAGNGIREFGCGS
jgi:hypothetical protein